MQRTTLASADCFVQWQSTDALHTDRQFFGKIDFWRDILPGDLGEQLQDNGPGINAEVDLAPGEQIPAVDSQVVQTVNKHEVDAALSAHHSSGLYQGRFYPRGLLAGCNGISDIYRQDLHPFRVSRIDAECIKVDLNHPLAGYPLKVGAKIDRFLTVREERGGHCNDIVADIAELGPGMQCRPRNGTVSFTHEHAFDRIDASDDAGFYQSPRLVHHIDSQARTFINQIYRRFITPDMRVLDLMSSWVSHLDGVPDSVEVTGLGMNATELAANLQLSGSLLHDINKEPCLPFADASFDIVICSASVEYLIRPFEIFSEAGRVLKPGGHFIVTFSDRWFPPKVIQLWTELHPFERMGLVLEYFRHSGQFCNLATESCRGWPRPADDKYYPQRLLADPVYAVRGTQRMNSLLLVAHGSRREASNDEIRALTRKLQRKAGNRFGSVSCAFLELAEPSIPDGIRQCIGHGATRVTVFPYFLSAGRHVATDIPAEVNKIVNDYPDIEITIAPYLGAAGIMSELILQQAG